MKLREIQLPTDIMEYLKKGSKLLLISKFDYCIVKLDSDTNKIVDCQCNVNININKHPYNRAYELIDEVPKDIISKDRIERIFHLIAIKELS